MHIVTHPLVQDYLTRLRDRSTDSTEFRAIAHRLTTIIALEATRDFPIEKVNVETPMETTEGVRIGVEIAAVPILRAGLGMLEAVASLFPQIAIGYVGLERDEATAKAGLYYSKLPDLRGTITLLLDPMLATGGSAIAATHLIKDAGGSDIRLLSMVAAPEGVRALGAAHSDVQVFVAALDRGLNDRKFILPGLGDFGDRLYNT